MAASNLAPGSPVMRWTSAIALGLAPLGCALDLMSRATGYSSLSWGGVLTGLSLLAIIQLGRQRPRPHLGTEAQPLDERELTQNLNTYVRASWFLNMLALANWQTPAPLEEEDDQ